MDGIAIPWADVPLELIEQHRLSRLLHERGGERELRFLRRVPEAVLPVWHDGLLRIVSWGSRSGRLPRSGYTWLRTVEAGEWAAYHAEPVTVPASAGLHNGVWYRIRQGVRGLYAECAGVSAVYVMVEPASYYYRTMTRAERMPALLGERI